MRARLVLTVAALVMAGAMADARPAPRWQTVPLPPSMPEAKATGFVEVGGARIFYAVHGKGAPVVLLHGGMGNGDHFAHQVPVLAEHFQVIAIDSRGHGRSTLGTGKLGYHGMAEDVIAVLDALAIERASLVGWSDGGSIALDLAIHHPERVSRLFVIGTSYDASGHRPRKGRPPSKTFAAYSKKCRADHLRLGGTAKAFQALVAALRPVWRSPGGFSKEQLRGIRAPTVVALGEHDEIIARAHAEEMARLIPGARLVIFDDTSHFTLWQDPTSVNRVLVEFLGSRESR